MGSGDIVSLIPIDIYTAASIGTCDAIIHILDAYPHLVNQANIGGWTALMYASFYGHQDAVNLLVARDASVHIRTNNGLSALMLATMCGHARVVESLVKFGSLLEVRDCNTWTCVLHAVHSRQSQVLQILLDAGANPNACDHRNGESPLILACRAADQTIVEELLRHGADPTLPDYTKNTASSVAASSQCRVIAELLTKAIAARGSDSDGSSLKRVLTGAGLADYFPLLQEQAVDLHVFLTMTDADLKECGISKLGPRRKMTALITRWHSNVPARSVREAAFADRLQVEKQELLIKLERAEKTIKALTEQVEAETSLRSRSESLVVEARDRLQRCHLVASKLSCYVLQMRHAVLMAGDYECQHTACLDIMADSLRHSSFESSLGEGRVCGHKLCERMSKDTFSPATPVCTSNCAAEPGHVPESVGEAIVSKISKCQFWEENEFHDNYRKNISNVVHKVLHERCESPFVDANKPRVIVTNLRTFNFDKDQEPDYLQGVKNDTNYISANSSNKDKLNSAIMALTLKNTDVRIADIKSKLPKLCYFNLGTPISHCITNLNELLMLCDPNLPRNFKDSSSFGENFDYVESSSSQDTIPNCSVFDPTNLLSTSVNGSSDEGKFTYSVDVNKCLNFHSDSNDSASNDNCDQLCDVKYIPCKNFSEEHLSKGKSKVNYAKKLSSVIEPFLSEDLNSQISSSKMIDMDSSRHRKETSEVTKMSWTENEVNVKKLKIGSKSCIRNKDAIISHPVFEDNLANLNDNKMYSVQILAKMISVNSPGPHNGVQCADSALSTLVQ